MHLQDVTPSLLKQYEDWMVDDQGNSTTTVGINVRTLRRVINKAIAAKEFPRDDYPFGKDLYQEPEGDSKKQTISWDQLCALVDYETQDKKQQYARAIWMTCYFAAGRNPTDIFRMTWSCIDKENKTITFERRQKTKNTSKKQQPVVVELHDDLQALIDKYGQKKNTEPDDYVFPVVDKSMKEEEIVRLIDKEIRRVNIRLHDIAKELKFKCKSFTLGVARCSMANFLLGQKVTVEKISKIMGHQNTKTTQLYLNSIQQTMTVELRAIRPESKKKNNLKAV